MSQRVLTHTFNGAASESFSQTFAWDNLGHVASLGYPQCTFAACSGVAASPRTVVVQLHTGVCSPGFPATRG